jgi:hypothetical protein
VVAQYKQLKADEKEGKVAQGAAHKFYRKNKKAIDEAGECGSHIDTTFLIEC